MMAMNNRQFVSKLELFLTNVGTEFRSETLTAIRYPPPTTIEKESRSSLGPKRNGMVKDSHARNQNSHAIR
jgi:hypothetical protein